MRLLTLGGLSLVDAHGTAVGQQKRRLALLALLSAANEHGLSRDRLVAFLSPESSTESARHSLQQLVYYLRQQVGENVFLGTDPLRLNPDVVTSDVQDFAVAYKRGDLAAAGALYRGPFLDGFHLDSAGFQEWVDGERTRLAAQHDDVLFRLANAADAAGHYAVAIDCWRQLATIDPLSSRVALGLMRSLAASGDSPAAIRHARVHEALMRDELGGRRGADPEVARLVAQLEGKGSEAQRIQLASPVPPVAAVPIAATTIEGARPQGSALATRRPARIAMWGGIGLVLVASGLMTLRAVRDARGHESANAITMIAVLPFQNLADSSHAYFASGLQDELLTQLSKVHGLTVKSRQSVTAYAAPHAASVKQIARELEVGSVVEATVQVVGNRIRVTVQLIDASTDAHLWGEHYDRTLDDVFAIQSDLAEQIVAAVGVALTDVERRAIAAPYTKSPAAYRLYLQARDYLRRPYSERPNVITGQGLLERAIALDSAFALAHAALSEVHAICYWLRYDRSPARAARARAEADVALRLAPDLPQAHSALGGWYYFTRSDYPLALAQLRLAVRGLPNDPPMWSLYARVNRRMGNWTESIAAHEKTTQLDPRSTDVFKELGVTYMYARRYVEARAAYAEALSLAPDLNYPATLSALTWVLGQGQLDTLRGLLAKYPWRPDAGARTMAGLDLAHWDRDPDKMLRMAKAARRGAFFDQNITLPAALYAAWAYRLQGNDLAARRAFDAAIGFADSGLRGHDDDDRLHASRGLAYAGIGDRVRALGEARWLQQTVEYRNDRMLGRIIATNRARILAQLGDVDAAVAELESVLSAPAPYSVHVLKLDPIWDPLRQAPQFKALLARHAQ